MIYLIKTIDEIKSQRVGCLEIFFEPNSIGKEEDQDIVTKVMISLKNVTSIEMNYIIILLFLVVV